VLPGDWPFFIVKLPYIGPELGVSIIGVTPSLTPEGTFF